MIAIVRDPMDERRARRGQFFDRAFHDQVAFPMPRRPPLVDLSGALAYQHHVLEFGWRISGARH